MGLLALLLFGALVGWLTGFFINKEGGILMNIVVGIGGAFIGGFLFQALGGAGITGFNLYSVVVGVIGSIVFLSILRWVK